MTGRIIRIAADPAAEAALAIASRLHNAVRRAGRATLALSGGATAPPMLEVLAAQDLPWSVVDVWQVDERVAPDGDPDRNAGQLAALPGRHHLMPVTAADLGRASRRYASGLPEHFDVVHLGMGPDGHTASWPPGDGVVDSELAVDLSGQYQGRVRMTFTPGVVNAARRRVVVVTGEEKSPAVAVWLEGDPDPAELPIALVHRTDTVVILDEGAAAGLDRFL